MKNPTIETGASRLAGLAVLAFAGFGAGIALMHVLRPDYALANHMVSDYAVGPWGAVMTGAFACASIGCLALAIGLVRSRLVSGVGWLVVALFAVAAVGLTVTALYPTDVGEGPPTPTGEIHTMSFLVNILSIVLASIGLAIVSFRDARWRTYRVGSVVLSLLLIVALVVQIKTLHRGMPYGLANRAFVVVLVAWLLSTAWTLRRLSLGAAARSAWAASDR